MPILKRDLTAIQGRKAPAKPYKLADGGGFYILVTTTGSLLGRYDYRRKADGKRKTLALGVYGETPPSLDLNQLRAAHQAARIVVANGGDPAAAKKIAVVRSSTLGEIADAWLKTRTTGKPNSRAFDARHVRYLKDGYRKIKGFGDTPIADVRVKDLSPLLGEFNKPSRVRLLSCARMIVAFAKAQGLIEHSLFSDVKFEAGFAKHTVTSRPAITNERQFGDLLRKVDVYAGCGNILVRDALQLLALTFVRPGTVQKAEWAHFGLDARLWTIPFDQLKMAHQRETSDDFVGAAVAAGGEAAA